MFSGYFGFVAEPLELFTQDGIRHRAQHRAGLIHRAVVPGAPSIIARDLAGLRVDSIGVPELLGKPGQLSDHRMDMALRVGGAARLVGKRAEEPRGGKEWVGKCRIRWSA